jgi:hypothetical protein
MKFVASYYPETGEITALCALPADPDAPSPGMQLRPGEARAEFEVPDDEAVATTADASQLRTRMEDIVASFRVESSQSARLVRSTTARR